MRFIAKPLIYISYYAIPALSICGIALSSHWISRAGDETSHTVAILLLIGSIFLFIVSSLLLIFAKRKVCAVMSLMKSATRFTNQNLVSILTILSSLIVSSGVFCIIIYGIVLRLVAADLSAFRNLPLGMDSDAAQFLGRGLKASVSLWIIASLALFIWTSNALQGWTCIVVALNVQHWVYEDRCDESKGLSSYRTYLLRHMKDALYHWGSAALGGLVMTIVTGIRWLVKLSLRAIEKANRTLNHRLEVLGETDMVSCCSWHHIVGRILSGLNLVLAVLDRCVRFISHQAYIHTALLNCGFLEAAYTSFLLMIKNGGTVTSVVLISRFSKYTMCLLVTALVGLCIWLCCQIGLGPDFVGTGLYFMITCIASSWIICGSLFNLHTVVMDTLMHIQLLEEDIPSSSKSLNAV